MLKPYIINQSIFIAVTINKANSEEKWDSVKRYKLTKMLNRLSNISGHGTELVTVYVPPKRPLFDVIAQLKNEAGTASNITRANAKAAGQAIP